MYLEVPGFLTPDEVSRALGFASSDKFEDGLSTLKGDATYIKSNEQLTSDAEATACFVELVTGALSRSAEASAFVRAKSVGPPMLSRYGPGKYYGQHQDTPIVGNKGGMMRRDLSMTVFLCDPAAYEGGALILQTDYGDIECKPEAGTAVIYSTGLWHEVEEVTSGERLALVTWFQSLVRDPGLRTILYDVAMASAEITAAAPGSDAARRLQKAVGDMTRRWSEV